MNEQTHYLTFKRKVFDGRSKVEICKLTKNQYESILTQRENKSNCIKLPNKSETIIDWKQIDLIERVSNDMKNSFYSSDYLVICPYCGDKYTNKASTAHIDECLNARRLKWEGDNPEKTGKWDKICKKIFSIKDENMKEKAKRNIYSNFKRNIS